MAFDRERVIVIMQELGSALNQQLPEMFNVGALGFTLMVFEVGGDGGSESAHVSNMHHPDLIRAVKSWLTAAETDELSDQLIPPTHRGKS